MSPETIGRMVSYFARHEVDKKGQGWSPGEDGFPSAGRIAWALWGGDAGAAWAGKVSRQMDARDDAEAAESLDLLANCGIGPGGFEEGNSCGGGSGGGGGGAGGAIKVGSGGVKSHSVKLPKQKTKLNISTASKALGEMGIKLGSPSTKLVGGKFQTNYKLTLPDGSERMSSAEDLQNIVYEGAK